MDNGAILVPVIPRSPVMLTSQEERFDFSNVPLLALGHFTRHTLSKLLNPKKILLSEEGYWRDWRGIAYLAKLQTLYGPTIITESDPMAKVLQLWCSNSENNATATFAVLLKFLECIDRWDVSDDIHETLVEDAKAFNAKKSQQLAVVPNNHLLNKSINSTDLDFIKETEAHLLTKDDVRCAEQGLPLQQYDAFLLFADEDVNYALEMINRLEESTSNALKLCVKDRDLLAGVSFEHEAITQLIEERCHRVIVILTSAFLNSPANSFLVNYTQALQIQQKKRKIIPCLYERDMVVPRTLKIYFFLKYTPDSSETTKRLYNFWEKLVISIRSVPTVTETPLSLVSDIVRLHSLSENEPVSIQTTKRSLMPSNRTFISTISTNTQSENAQLPIIDAPKKRLQVKTDKSLIKKKTIADISKVHTTSEPTLYNAFSGFTSCEKLQEPICDSFEDSNKQSLPDLPALSSATSKKGTKWLKSLRKNTNTWFKKHLNTQKL